MSDLASWLQGRQPRPPTAMKEWLDAGFDGTRPLYRTLGDRGLEALDRARAAPGRVRDSALHLLTADALLTYACEAALEAPDPGAALWEILDDAAVDRR